jgi:hypothetical protein
MAENSKTLLGQCNANGCSTNLQSMSTSMNNTTIYAHKSYSLAATLYLGKGKYYSKFLMQLTGYHTNEPGAVENQGKYLKIQGGNVTDVNKISFSTSAENAGEIKE